MARPSKHDGSIYPRKDGKALWMVYRDRNGKRIRESTFTEDWQEAQRKLRERLQFRDDRILDVVRKGEQLRFADWVDFFLENYSRPPIRAEKTHEANQRAASHLKEAFRQPGATQTSDTGNSKEYADMTLVRNPATMHSRSMATGAPHTEICR